MKKKVLLTALASCTLIAFLAVNHFRTEKTKKEEKAFKLTKNKKTPEERALFHEERVLDELRRIQNPTSGNIPKIELEKELSSSLFAKQARSSSKLASNTYVNRGPSNLGGRTRALVVDRSDNTGNTIIAAGVSGGVYRTTNGGASWTRVSPLNDIPNVTTIVQDPRAGFESIWYYGTGEALSGSASTGASAYYGRGIWQSIDGGLTWSQFAGTNSTQDIFDSQFDFIYKLAVDPTTGYLFAALPGRVMFYLPAGVIPPNVGWFDIKFISTTTAIPSDVAITSSGRIYTAFGDFRNDPDDPNIPSSDRGVWVTNSITSASTQISSGEFLPSGRPVIALAPSNEDKLYVLFDNGNEADCNDSTPAIEADLWMWNEDTDTWTDYSSKLPDEPGCSNGNDPFAIQGGYDLVVNVKPDDENFVVIGGTNAYKIEDITTDIMFSRIGGYANTSGYSIYNAGGTEHHPDLHAMVFNPFNNDVLFTGSDGGVHRTDDVTAASVEWTSLNNNYQTQQYYHVAIDPQNGSDFVLGGLQDNGTNQGGTGAGESNLTEQTRVLGGDGVAVGISRDNILAPTFVGTQNGSIYRRNKDLAPGFINAEITPRISIGTPPNEDELYPSQFVTYFYLDPSNNNALYYASEDNLLRTTDATSVTQDTWTNMGATSTITGGVPGESLQIFSATWGTYNAASSYLLIGTDNGNIYRLDDPQNVANVSGAVKITPPSVSPTSRLYVSGLAIHPTNSDIVLATYSNYGVSSIFLTTNATSATPTWTLVEDGIASHSVRCAAIAEVSGETVYFVGTARGLYSNSDPLNDNWTLESPNQIGFALVRSFAYRPSDNRLLIGTHGNGMYEATITSTLGVNDAKDISSEITLFPNPVTSQFELKTPLNSRSYDYTISNVSGQTVMKGTSKNKAVNVSNLTSGIYFLSLKMGNNVGIKKFVKK